MERVSKRTTPWDDVPRRSTTLSFRLTTFFFDLRSYVFGSRFPDMRSKIMKYFLINK